MKKKKIEFSYFERKYLNSDYFLRFEKFKKGQLNNPSNFL